MEHGEARGAVIVSVICFLIAIGIATMEESSIVALEARASEMERGAAERDALRDRVAHHVALLRSRFTFPPDGIPPAIEGVTIGKIKMAETSWSMEADGSAGKLASVIGGNLRNARITSGSQKGLLRAELEFDSIAVNSASLTVLEVEKWIEKQEAP